MAASGAMWVKPNKGPLAGQRVVLSRADQAAYTRMTGGVSPSKDLIEQGLGTSHLAQIKRAVGTSSALRGDVVEFDKTARAGLTLNGVPLQPGGRGFWKGAKDRELGEEAWPASSKKHSTGAIVVEPDGRIWIVEPTNHYGGYKHTFPKGRVEKGLTAQQNALKEVYEESGLQVRLTGIVGHFEGDTTVTRYYLARRTGGAPWTAHWESQAVKLVTPAKAKTMLNKQRDKDVLAAVLQKVKER